MQDSAAFLLLVAGSAEDIALRCKKDESKQAIVYTEKALSIINKRMREPQAFISDGALAACTTMAGIQVSHIFVQLGSADRGSYYLAPR
jgi:quinolinate synthase